MALVSFSLRPLSSAGRIGKAPLDHRMMMVVVPAEAGNVHKLFATLQTPLPIVNRTGHAMIPSIEQR